MSKQAIVIGASRGIGLGLVKELAKRGYRVTATERDRSDALHILADGSDGAVSIAQCDVTDEASCSALARAHEAGSVDLLIVNAGVYGPKDQSLAALDRESVADIVHTNAVGPVQAALTLLPVVKDGGLVCLMTSKMGSIDDSSGGANHYRASKVVQNMLARSLFEQHAKPRGIGVVSQHPGWVQTDMGGPNAPVDVATSTAGIIDALEGEAKPRHAFLNYDGTPIPW